MGTLFLRTISLKNFFKELVTDLKKKNKTKFYRKLVPILEL